MSVWWGWKTQHTQPRHRAPRHLNLWPIFLSNDPLMELSDSMNLLKMCARLYVCVFMRYGVGSATSPPLSSPLSGPLKWSSLEIRSLQVWEGRCDKIILDLGRALKPMTWALRRRGENTQRFTEVMWRRREGEAGETLAQGREGQEPLKAGRRVVRSFPRALGGSRAPASPSISDFWPAEQ